MPPLTSFAPPTDPTPLAAPRRAHKGQPREIHEPAPLLDHEVAWLFDAGPSWWECDGKLVDVYAACHVPYIPPPVAPAAPQPAPSSALALREHTGEFVTIGPAELVGRGFADDDATVARVLAGLRAIPPDPADPLAVTSGELVAVKVHPELTPVRLPDDAEAELADAWAALAGHPLDEARSHRRGRRDAKAPRGRRGRRFPARDAGASSIAVVIAIVLAAFVLFLAVELITAQLGKAPAGPPTPTFNQP